MLFNKSWDNDINITKNDSWYNVSTEEEAYTKREKLNFDYAYLIIYTYTLLE